MTTYISVGLSPTSPPTNEHFRILAHRATAPKSQLETFPGRYAGAFSKRVLDVICAGIGLLLLAPLFALVAICIKLEDGGPIFFRQKRTGLGGREFWCPKFRSMVVNAEALKQGLVAQNQHRNGITFKIKRDPRITVVGRYLRKTSIDELPQLWNVLVGDMSVVGPRPALPSEVARYTPWQRRRLDVRPGLTCIWQVEGRGDVPFEQQVQMDIRYIERQSFFFDIALILRTFPAVLTARGAY